MKPISLIFLIILFSFSHSPKIKTNAKVSGYDIARCACCGGWVVYVDGKRKRVKNKIPNWEYPFSFSNIAVVNGDTIEMPVDVLIEYTESDFCNKIIVNNIEIINMGNK